MSLFIHSVIHSFIHSFWRFI